MSTSLIISPSSSFPKSKKRWKFLLITITIVIASVVLFLFDPATSKLYPPSPFRAITGLYCPGCGTLRALHQLLHGHLLEAFGLNPLMMLSLPFLTYSYISYGVEAIKGKPLFRIFIPAKWIWFLLEMIVAYWIVRNIPIAPFSWLAP